LVPNLFELKAGNRYIALAGEQDARQVLRVIGKHLKPDQRIFVGVIAPIDRYIEAPEEVKVRSFAARQPKGGAWLS
jgi:5-methyltetrahydropteroyltriglutamate--homocysteine methyltransferase